MPDQWSPPGALGQVTPNTYSAESTGMLDLFSAKPKGQKPTVRIIDNLAEKHPLVKTVERKVTNLDQKPKK
jgi:hypothetical protein